MMYWKKHCEGYSGRRICCSIFFFILLTLLLLTLSLHCSVSRVISVLVMVHFWDVMFCTLLVVGVVCVRWGAALGPIEAALVFYPLHVLTFPFHCDPRLHCTKVLFSQLVTGFLMWFAPSSSLRSFGMWQISTILSIRTIYAKDFL